MRRWHRHVLRHDKEWVRVSPPTWDISAKGWLVKCACGKDWAL
jgi:hypothetical protein